MTHNDCHYIEKVTFEQVKALTLQSNDLLNGFDKQFSGCEVRA